MRIGIGGNRVFLTITASGDAARLHALTAQRHRHGSGALFGQLLIERIAASGIGEAFYQHLAFRVVVEECGQLLDIAVAARTQLRSPGVEQHIAERHDGATLGLLGLERLQRLELGGTHLKARLGTLGLDTLKTGLGLTQHDGLLGRLDLAVGQVGELLDLHVLAVLSEASSALPRAR